MRDQADAAAWLNEHRGKAAIAPPPGVGRAVFRLIKPLEKRFSRPSPSELNEHWSAIVGPQLAAHTRPEKFQGGSTLVIRARGPAATLIQAQSPQILSRVAAYSGRQPCKLKIIQGPLSAPDLKPRPRLNRITRVEAAPVKPRSLEDTLEDWRLAVERRSEGVRLPVPPPRSET